MGRICPACLTPVEEKDELISLKIKRKKLRPTDIELKICNNCFVITANVLAYIKDYYPEQIIINIQKD